MDLAALHVAAEQEHQPAVPVVGPVVAVLAGGAPELGHDQHEGLLQERAQVLGEARQELIEATLWYEGTWPG